MHDERWPGGDAPAPTDERSGGGKGIGLVVAGVTAAGLVATWLRSRQRQPALDARTADRLAPRPHPVPSAADIHVGGRG